MEAELDAYIEITKKLIVAVCASALFRLERPDQCTHTHFARIVFDWYPKPAELVQRFKLKAIYMIDFEKESRDCGGKWLPGWPSREELQERPGGRELPGDEGDGVTFTIHFCACRTDKDVLAGFCELRITRWVSTATLTDGSGQIWPKSWSRSDYGPISIHVKWATIRVSESH